MKSNSRYFVKLVYICGITEVLTNFTPKIPNVLLNVLLDMSESVADALPKLFDGFKLSVPFVFNNLTFDLIVFQDVCSVVLY